MVNKQLIKKIVILTIVFTILDYLLHHYEFFMPSVHSVGTFYFIGKLIALPIILYFLITLFNMKGRWMYAIAAVLLQTRYYLTYGYDLKTNIIMVTTHYSLMLIASIIIENKEVSKIIPCL